MAEIAPDSCMAGMLAGHQHTPGRGTYRASGVGLGKTQTVCGQLVDIRGFDLFLSVTSQVTVTQVIGHNENDIGPAAGHFLSRYLFTRFRLLLTRTGRNHRNKQNQADC
jgi:hypothetical protein